MLNACRAGIVRAGMIEDCPRLSGSNFKDPERAALSSCPSAGRGCAAEYRIDTTARSSIADASHVEPSIDLLVLDEADHINNPETLLQRSAGCHAGLSAWCASWHHPMTACWPGGQGCAHGHGGSIGDGPACGCCARRLMHLHGAIPARQHERVVA